MEALVAECEVKEPLTKEELSVLRDYCSGQYHDAVLDALPVMPRTSLLEDVEQFMLEHKPDRYFKELKQPEWDRT